MIAVKPHIFADVRVGDEKILETVIIEIVHTDAPAAHAMRGEADSRRIGPGHEEAASLIDVERKRLAFERRHDHIRTAIII